MRKIIALLILCTVFTASCGPLTVKAPFFRMQAPEDMIMLDVPEYIGFKIALGLTRHEIKSLTDITNSVAFMSFNWREGDYSLGKVENLGIGTMPPGASIVSQGQEQIGGMSAWCQQTKQQDLEGNQVLRTIHSCMIPFDGGLLEIVSSVDPRSKVTIQMMKDSLKSLEVMDKNYFINLKNEKK
jgi:hypothetical protein